MTTPLAEADGFNDDFLDGGMSDLLASVSPLAGRWHQRHKL